MAFEKQLKVKTRNAQGSASGQIPGRLGGIQLGIPAAPGQDLAVSYRYDTFGRFDQVTGPTGDYTYSRTPNSDLLAGLVSPVHTVAQTYEPQPDLADPRSKKAGSTVLSSFDYLNDPLGRRVQRAHAGAVFGPGSTDIYGYNARSGVVGVTNAAASSRARSYVYDEIGNRRNYVPSSNPPNTPLQHTYLANALNQYTSISAPWVSQSPTYDADGNQTSGRFNSSTPNLALSWDAENRLFTSEAHELRRVTNAYAAFGRRVRRSVFTCGTSIWSLIKDEKFIYDGWNVVAVLNAVPNALPILRTHVWGLDLSATRQGAGGIGGLLGVKDCVATYHYLYDAHGNVSEILNATGAGVAHYEYDAFGQTTVATGSYSQINEYRFSTKPFESETGLYYYGFRYYNPSTGRWLSRDPIEEDDGPNMYAMVQNNPVSAWDYLGLATNSAPWSVPNGDFAYNELITHYFNARGAQFSRSGGAWGDYMKKAPEKFRTAAKLTVLTAVQNSKLRPTDNGVVVTGRTTFNYQLYHGGSKRTGYYLMNGPNPYVLIEYKFTVDKQCNLKGKLDFQFWDKMDANLNPFKHGWSTAILDAIHLTYSNVVTLGNATDFELVIHWKSEIVTPMRDTTSFAIGSGKGWPLEKQN